MQSRPLTFQDVSHIGDPNSFAYITARTRWPKILVSAIDEINDTVKNNGNLSSVDVNAAEEIKKQLTSLKASIAADGALQFIPNDGGPDVEAWNQELRINKPTWLNSPWLYTECYMYRFMHTFYTMSTPFWRSFDMFVTGKRKSLIDSKMAAIELVKKFRETIQAIADKEIGAEGIQKALFEEMVEISLWGNATDLSLLASLSVEELQSRQGKAAREKSKANIVADDTEQVWTLLSKLKSSTMQNSIHVVLDNAGFELLADLVFIGFLIESGYASKVILHGKRMPWFVSDVNALDLIDLVHGFADGSTYSEISNDDRHEIQEAGTYWKSLLDAGKMEFRAHPFWTTQHSYGRMPEVEPKLFEELSAADLVVYKGDLNYRKLTYDGNWPRTTTFEEALGPLAKKHLGGKGHRSLVLRTCKADVCVGLKPGVEEKLPPDWTRNGRYAVVSYWDGKS